MDHWKNIYELSERIFNRLFLRKQEKENAEDEIINKISERLQDENYLIERLSAQMKYDAKKAFSKIKSTKKINRKILWLNIASSVILLIGMSIAFIIYNDEKRSTIQIAELNPIFPELITHDGQRIVLLPENETINLNDSLIIKSNNLTLDLQDLNFEFEEIYQTITIPKGAEYNIILSDGSEVYLNSGSELRFPISFHSDKRELFLIGEAFFRVQPDNTRPFIVNSEEMKAVVLGTSFNIRSYKQHNDIAATLEEGSLQILLPDGEYIMTPGMQVKYEKDKNESVMKNVNTELYTSWKDGYYFFDRMRLEEILTTISLWYDFNIQFIDDEAKDLPFTGQLKRYEDFEYLLEKFEETETVKFTIHEKEIYVSKK